MLASASGVPAHRAHSTSHTSGTVRSRPLGGIRTKNACSWQDSIEKGQQQAGEMPHASNKGLASRTREEPTESLRQTTQLQKAGEVSAGASGGVHTHDAPQEPADRHEVAHTWQPPATCRSRQGPAHLHGRATSQRHKQPHHVPVLLPGGQLAQPPRKRQLLSVANGLRGDPGTPPQGTVSRNAHVSTPNDTWEQKHDSKQSHHVG